MNLTPTLRHRLLHSALFTAVTGISPLHAQLYFDVNAATAGSGTPAAATWNTGTNWSTDAAGAIEPVAWSNGQQAIFSAGTEAAGTWAVTIDGTVQTNSLLFNGTANTIHNISGGTIDLGTGGLTFTSSAAGGTTGRSKTIASAIIGTGQVTIAANGDTSATGGGSNTLVGFTGTNTFTGDITITSGIVSAASNFGNAANTITLNGGGLVDPNLNIALARDLHIGTAGGVIRNYGSVTNFRLQGDLTGSGEIRRTDGGTTVLTGDGSGFAGALNIQRGTMQIGDGTQTGNLLPNVSGVTLGDAGGAGTLRYTLDSSFTLGTPVTIANAGSTFAWQGTQVADTLTLTNSLGSSTASGNLRVASGTLALAPGSDTRVTNVQVTSTPANSATAEIGMLSINGDLRTRFMNIGEGGSTAGRVNQTGGTVTIEAGGNGFRVGHWANGSTPGSVYNLSGGTLDASVTAVNIGWDGEGDMTVGGGSGTALLKAGSIQVDANGVTPADMSLTLSPNGTAEVTGAVASAGTTDRVFLNGGTLRGTGNATWSAPFTTGTGTTSTFDIRPGVTTLMTGELIGEGDLNVTGEGTLAITGNAAAFTGDIVRTGGTFAGAGVIGGDLTVNGAISPGTAAQPVGKLDLGAIGTTTTLNGDIIMDVSPTADASGTDLISVYENVTFGPQAVLRPRFNGIPTANVHRLIEYFEIRTGAPALDSTLQIRGLNLALDTSVSGEVNLNVTGTASPGSLVWSGDGTGNAWNVNSAANWGSQTFFQYDSVLFDDSGNNASPVTITGQLTPGAVTVSGTKDYTFTGTGSLVGGATLTKDSTGDLTVLNNNNFGTVNLNAGRILVGNGGATGSIGENGGITLAGGTTLEFNTTSTLGYNRPATAGSTGTLIKGGTGTLNIGVGATLLPTSLIVDGGTVNVSGGGFSGNRMEGAGQVTVNAGATLVIPAGSAHAFGGNNVTMTESFSILGGTLTLNQEQYFNSFVLDGATINGSSEFRTVAGSTWLVTGSAPTTATAGVNHVAAGTWNVEDVTGSAAPDLILSGRITGAGALNKNGAGTLRATGANTATAPFVINAGTFEAGSNTALGFGGGIGLASVNGTTVNAGATLDLQGVTVNEIITLNGGGLLTNSNTTTAATLSNGVAGIRVVDAGSGYTAAPTLTFAGGGGTGVTATAGVTTGALSSITTTAPGTGYTSAPTVTVTGAGSLATATAQISQLLISGADNQIGGAGNLSLAGIMIGSGSYSKVGSGTVTLPTAGSTFTGNIAINAGTLSVTGGSAGITTGLGANALVGTERRIITVNDGGTLAFGTNNILGNGAVNAATLPLFVVGEGGVFSASNYNVIGPVTLNGGILTADRTGTPGGYQGFELKGTITAAGNASSLISATSGFGHHLAGTIPFDVAGGSELVVAAPLRNASPDVPATTGALTKTGEGLLLLNATNTYTGVTTVSAGTLGGTGSVQGPLDITATGTLAPGTSAGTFGAGATTLAGTYAFEIDGAAADRLAVTGDLNLTGSTLDIRVLAGGATAGTYVIASYTGALTGTFGTVENLPPGYSISYSTPGQILLTSGTGGDAFSVWAAANGIPASGATDSDGDGIPNGIEFVIGGKPSGANSDSSALLPEITVDDTYLNFTFRRTDDSASFNPHVEFGSTLMGWNDVEPGEDGVVIDETDDVYGEDIDRVIVRIPRSLADTDGKLFVRLAVDIP